MAPFGRAKTRIVERDFDELAAGAPVGKALAPADSHRDIGTVFCRSRIAVITSRRVDSSTGTAVAGRSAVTPCSRCTTNRGWARKFA